MSNVAQKAIELGKSLLTDEQLFWYEVPPLAWAHAAILALIGEGAFLHPYYRVAKSDSNPSHDKVGVMVCPKYRDKDGNITKSIVPRSHGNVAYPRLLSRIF